MFQRQLFGAAEKVWDAAQYERQGQLLQNAAAENFFSSLTNEIVHHRNYHTRDEARTEIFEYIELFYNRKRLHQLLNYLKVLRLNLTGIVRSSLSQTSAWS